ncbi:SERTA domain-containing protein 3 isoform 1-T4 [Synchiropus picturatus]
MIMKGQKRKLPQDELEDVERCASWENQRQFIFSVSLNKYQQSQELPEPSLRRSVLIANTLRQVSMEPCSSHDAPVLAEHDQAGAPSGAPAWEHQTGAAHSGSAASCPTTEPEEDWESMSSDPDLSITAAISSIITALECSTEPSAAPRTPLRSLENLELPPEIKYGMRLNGTWDREEETSVEALKSSYLHDVTMEDLFQDIDTSLLERDMGVLGLRGSSSGDDLLMYLPTFSASSQPTKCLPSFSSFASPSFSSPSFSAPPSFSGQSPLREALDLDHLMEILVES